MCRQVINSGKVTGRLETVTQAGLRAQSVAHGDCHSGPAGRAGLVPRGAVSGLGDPGGPVASPTSFLCSERGDPPPCSVHSISQPGTERSGRPQAAQSLQREE